MQTELYLLVLQPNRDLEIDSPYMFISNDESMPLIPSISLQPSFANIENVLESIIQHYIGIPSFNIDYVLYDVRITNGTLHIFYYCFIPSSVSVKEGFLHNIQNIQNVTSYQKLIKKLF